MDDISVFGEVMEMIMEVMNIPITIYGFTFTLWSTAVWDVMTTAVVFFIYSAFFDD